MDEICDKENGGLEGPPRLLPSARRHTCVGTAEPPGHASASVPTVHLSGTAGKTAVPSLRTASSSRGSMCKAWRMVGATWAVPTDALTVPGLKLGLDSSRMTLVSSCAKPPCSACLWWLPE